MSPLLKKVRLSLYRKGVIEITSPGGDNGGTDIKFEPLSELDHPLGEIVENANRMIEAGADVYFKFTCEKCRARQMFDRPNSLYYHGSCEECGHVTDLRRRGANFMVVTAIRKGGK
jgi:hypothetical protein